MYAQWRPPDGPAKDDGRVRNLVSSETGVFRSTNGQNGPWTKVTVNLSSHEGHYVTVTFINHDDGAPSTPTYTLIDDVAFG